MTARWSTASVGSRRSSMPGGAAEIEAGAVVSGPGSGSGGRGPPGHHGRANVAPLLGWHNVGHVDSYYP